MVDELPSELDRLHARIAPRFTRSEPRRRARQYLSGLVADLTRKNGWTLAERAGDVSPDGMQRLLRRADWDVDGVRDDVRDYVIEHLGDPGGVLMAGEAGFPKRGTGSAGVARQYSVTSGRIENCQVGVFLAYRSGRGLALIDRELYLPREWTADPVRCRTAGIGSDAAYVTRARIAERMATRALAADDRLDRVTDDRRAIGECLRLARRYAGLDQYQVRDWRAWHAHITLSMAALAGLVVAGRLPPKGNVPPATGR